MPTVRARSSRRVVSLLKTRSGHVPLGSSEDPGLAIDASHGLAGTPVEHLVGVVRPGGEGLRRRVEWADVEADARRRQRVRPTEVTKRSLPARLAVRRGLRRSGCATGFRRAFPRRDRPPIVPVDVVRRPLPRVLHAAEHEDAAAFRGDTWRRLDRLPLAHGRKRLPQPIGDRLVGRGVAATSGRRRSTRRRLAAGAAAAALLHESETTSLRPLASKPSRFGVQVARGAPLAR